VFGVTDPKHPALVSLYDTPWAATGLALEGDTLYVADGFSGLRVLDVSEPAAPAEVGFYDTPGGAFGVALDGGYAYVADFAGGAWILRYVASPEEE